MQASSLPAMSSAIRRQHLRLVVLLVGAAAIGHADNIQSITMPATVYAGTPFVMEIRGSGNHFPITLSVDGCTGCTISPSEIDFVENTSSYTVTIYSPVPLAQGSVKISYGAKTI